MSQFLFNIELAYQNLRRCLKNPASNNFKLLCISDFLNLTVKEEYKGKFESYFLEIQPELFRLAFENEFNFISPDFITELLEKISILQNYPVFIDSQDDFKELSVHLKNVLNQKKSALNAYQPIKESASDSVAVVLIENNSIYNGIKTSAIHFLNLSSSVRPKGENTDKTEFKNLTDVSDNGLMAQLTNDVKIAKSECRNLGISTGYYNFTYWFNEDNYVYTGSSLGIAAICLAYNSILINELYKFYYKFYSDTVFTSEIDNSGNLVKMDNDILKIKLQGVFFSSFRKFIIPEDNLPEAKNELSILNEKYPERILELIPVKNYSSILRNLEIVERCELKFTQKAKALINKHHKAFNLTLAFISTLILLYFGYRVFLPMFDNNPVIKKYENDRLTAYNKHEKKLWESDFVLNIANENKKTHDRAINDNMILSDLDEDGKNEILTINTSSSDTMINRTVFCYNYDGNLKWKYAAPAHNINYLGNIYEDNFMYTLLCASDYKINGRRYFVTSGNIKQYFPCKLTIHAIDGRDIASYWHSGTLIRIKIIDIDSDGKEEIYACGVNNKARTSCLAVFDPLIMRGSSYQTNPLNDGVKGTEKYYIIFPRTFFSTLTPEGYSYAYSILQKTPVRIIIEVVEAINGNPYDDLNPVILYEFDEKMQILNAVLSSSFSSRYSDMKNDSSKKLPHINDWNKYRDSLKNAVQYWDGEKFVNERIINKNYLDVSAADTVTADDTNRH